MNSCVVQKNPSDSELCYYGCNKTAQFTAGKLKRPCCSRIFSQCSAILDKRKKTSLIRYGVLAFQAPDFREKSKATLLQNYGVTVPAKSPLIIQKMQDTSMIRYGVKNAMQSKDVVDKLRRTFLTKYGVVNPTQLSEVKERKIQTLQERYGCSCPFLMEDFQSKVQKFFQEKFGVNNPMQVPHILEKQQRSSLRSKLFVYPSGKITRLQGYEPQVVSELLKQGILEEEILTSQSKVPVIWYELKGRKRRYFPDFYIPHLNLILEVKSTWTLYGYSEYWEMNKAKRQACKDAGYNFNFLIRE
jgi:hypothetical protein